MTKKSDPPRPETAHVFPTLPRGPKAVLRAPPRPPRPKSSSPLPFPPALPPLRSQTLPAETFVPYSMSGASLSAPLHSRESRPPALPARFLEPPGPSIWPIKPSRLALRRAQFGDL